MQLDDLKQSWASYGSLIERSSMINSRLLRETLLIDVKSTFRRSKVMRVIEIVLGVATIVASVTVLTDHLNQVLYLSVILPLAVMAAFVTGCSAYCLLQYSEIDFSASVADLQRRVERIRVVEYRALKWSLLTGVLAWLPLGLVMFEAATGIDAIARVNSTWIVANVLFGLIFLCVGHAISKRWLEGNDLSPWALHIVQSLSGNGVRTATKRLEELSQFETAE